MKIGFFGDLVLDDSLKIEDMIEKNIRENDFNCLNLEAPFITEGYIPIKKSINLYHKIEDLRLMKDNKFTLVNLANNHVFDFGVEGFEHTKYILDKNEIEYFGAGKNLNEAGKPYIFELNGKKAAIFGFAWDFTDAINTYGDGSGTSPVDLGVIRNILSPFKDYDYKIAYFHFGTEYEYLPEPYQKYIIDILFDEDLLDIVIGTHPHSYHGYNEKFINGKKKIVFYSLGNFILPEIEFLDKRVKYKEEYHLCYYANIDFDNDLSFEIVPFKLINNSTEIRLLFNEELEEFNDHMKVISEPLKLNYKEYRKYYIKNRKRKFRPLMCENKIINKAKQKSYELLHVIKVYIYMKMLAFTKFLGIYKKLKVLKNKYFNI